MSIQDSVNIRQSFRSQRGAWLHAPGDELDWYRATGASWNPILSLGEVLLFSLGEISNYEPCARETL
jgi:hypothetical protein